MPRASRTILLAVIAPTVVGGWWSLASAQDDTPWQPVDQTVSDLDLRASSARRVEQGIGVLGQTGSLYRRPDTGPGWFVNGNPLSQQYQLREPGVTAWIDRPDYLVQDPLGEVGLNISPAQDRRFIDLVPPNTVFDLVPSTQRGFVPYTDIYDDGLGSTRVNTRIDGFIDTTATGQREHPLLTMPRAHRLPEHLQAQRGTSSSTPADSPHAQTPPPPDQDDQARDTPQQDTTEDTQSE